MARFGYDHEILERFPAVVGGAIHADGVSNRPAPAELTAAFQAEQASVKERIGQTPLSELPTLVAWRSVFRGFGVNPTKYRSAAAALLRRLTKQGELPSINSLVDLANLVSIRYALPVAVFDQRVGDPDVLAEASGNPLRECRLAVARGSVEEQAGTRVDRGTKELEQFRFNGNVLEGQFELFASRGFGADRLCFGRDDIVTQNDWGWPHIGARIGVILGAVATFVGQCIAVVIEWCRTRMGKEPPRAE